MTLAALAFAAGAAVLQLQAGLPGGAWAAALPLLALLAWWKPRTLALLAFAFGFAWAALLAHQRMGEWLAPELEGRDLAVVGVVSGLPARLERGTRFELEVEAVEGGHRLPPKVLLSWYRTPLAAQASDEGAAALAEPVRPGERWRFTVRLRRPHGGVNPHGFDYEAWLLERGIGATGYVRQRGAPLRLGTRDSLRDRIELAREAVRERFAAVLGATPAAGILAALAVGDQRAIAAEDWRLFNRTGVTHLMSISGLHVTLVSGLFAWLAAALWRRVPPLCLRLPARKAGAAAAILGALGYTLLSGFAVPAQRTFYMVAIVACALWAGRIAAPVRVLALAAAVVTLADPWAPLAPGFWLSFGAVALIFYVAGGRQRAPGEPARMERLRAYLHEWGRVQWAVTVGLAPAALLLFGQVSVAGPLANAVAIPVVSGVVTPLALAAAALPVDAFLHAGAWLVQCLLEFLEWCASLPGALWQQHVPPAWAAALALAGAAWLLAPRGVPWRACGLVLLAPAFAIAPAGPAHGEAWATALDVGQGLAVLVRTEHRVLLYDAGPAYGSEADSGGRVVLPALRGEGLARIDAMVLSHEDLDHVGGALSVLEAMEVGALLSSLPERHSLNSLAPARRCEAGQGWEWDGVRFDVLHPAVGEAAGAPRRRNDSSCVLRVATAGGALLLTGDIERAAEDALVARGAGLRADVLVVPHHGSRTSSTAAFIGAVSPRWAIVTAGYRNRFGHPDAQVAARYRDAGARLLRTDLDGAIRVSLTRIGADAAAGRERAPRYWRRSPRV